MHVQTLFSALFFVFARTKKHFTLGRLTYYYNLSVAGKVKAAPKGGKPKLN